MLLTEIFDYLYLDLVVEFLILNYDSHLLNWLFYLLKVLNFESHTNQNKEAPKIVNNLFM